MCYFVTDNDEWAGGLSSHGCVSDPACVILLQTTMNVLEACPLMAVHLTQHVSTLTEGIVVSVRMASSINQDPPHHPHNVIQVS